MSVEATGAEAMVNTERYPVGDLDSDSGIVLAKTCREEFVSSGLCILPGFIRPDALDELAREANSMLGQAYFCDSTHNAYLRDADPDLSSDDVTQRQEPTFVGSVAYDLLADHGALKRLYHWDPLKDFIAAILGKEPFFRFADPLGACSINVFVDGGRHGWHFDESEFTITLMLQQPDEGGLFEYVPQIRGLDNEKEIVRSVLDGNRQGVMQLPFTPGTLLVFAGNQTIHRVTKMSGAVPRLVPVLCYAERPDLVNSEEVRKLFWGRRTADG
jgi:hypothetical protein|tara:strand:+ start:1427 stop:2242 length:816 start_codon:yes stop_codon:yes gene_type:complete